MKRFISITLAAVLLILCFAGCGANAKQMTLDEFLDKYRRADLDALAPMEFLEDWNAVSRAQGINKDLCAAYLEWDDAESGIELPSGLFDKEKEVVLFNLPATISATVSEKGTSAIVSIEFTTGDAQKDLDISEKLVNALFDKYDEADDITIGYSGTATEPELRKLLSGSEIPERFSVSFTSLDFDDGSSDIDWNEYYYYYVSFYSFTHYDGRCDSHITIG